MTGQPREPVEPGDWRARAEALVSAQGAGEMNEVDAKRLVHELRVHQVELELQNEALREARLEAEAGWERFQALYDFSPAGYFSVDREGAILEMNLAGACLLGVARGQGLNLHFQQLLRVREQPSFMAFLHQSLGSPDHLSCEVTLPGPQNAGLRVRLQGTCSADGKVLQMVAMDITELAETREQVAMLNQLLDQRVELRRIQMEAASAELEAACETASRELGVLLRSLDLTSQLLLKLYPEGAPGPFPPVASRIGTVSERLRQVVDALLQRLRLRHGPPG